ncbi:retinol dehydrogenase 11 [Aspergillus germanicus]
MPSNTFDPSQDIPDLSGKVILVTGGTAGLGANAVIELSKHSPAHIYITGRNTKSAAGVIKQVAETGSKTPVSFITCDLALLASVKRAADEFRSKETRLDILMCSAGIMAVDHGLTADGYEVQFGTNHLGHALLIQRLLPVLQSSATLSRDVRIVLLTSLGFKMHPCDGISFDTLRTTQKGLFGSWVRYGQSKLANLLYARELAHRYPDITSVSVHPGVVNTGLVEGLSLPRRAFVWATSFHNMVTPEEGIRNQLWAATSGKDGISNGAFYEPVGNLSTGLDKTSKDDGLAKRLWEWTDEVLAEYYD